MGKIQINPLDNRLGYTCDDCHQQVNKLDYKERFRAQFEKLDSIKATINSEINQTIQERHANKQSTMYSCMTQGEGEDLISQMVHQKYLAELMEVQTAIWKDIVSYHLEKECGQLAANKSPQTDKIIKSKCLFGNCRIVGIKLDCSRCHKKYCTSHLQPEIHNCSSLLKQCSKVLTTPRQQILCH
jgi:hypothetical protein